MVPVGILDKNSGTVYRMHTVRGTTMYYRGMTYGIIHNMQYIILS